MPTPVLPEPGTAPRPIAPIAGYVPAAPSQPADDRPAGGDTQPVTSYGGSADTTANFAAVPTAEAPMSVGARIRTGVRLGPAVADYFGTVLVTDPSVLAPGKLFLGGTYLPLQASDGTLLSMADTPFSFMLSPETAAPLAGSGRPGPFRVFAFNADTAAFDELPTSLVLFDDGSVMITALPPAPPANVAVAAPTAEPASDAGPSNEDLANVDEPPADQPPGQAAQAPASEDLTDAAMPLRDPLAETTDTTNTTNTTDATDAT